MLYEEFTSIGICVSGFAVIRASKCWTLASDSSGAKFERRFACARQGIPVIVCVGWIDVNVHAGWMVMTDELYFFSTFASEDRRELLHTGHCTRTNWLVFLPSGLSYIG